MSVFALRPSFPAFSLYVSFTSRLTLVRYANSSFFHFFRSPACLLGSPPSPTRTRILGGLCLSSFLDFITCPSTRCHPVPYFCSIFSIPMLK